MTFLVNRSGLAGVTGHYTIDFAPYGAYWLVADGTIEINVRVFGVSAKHTTLRWTIADFTTPSALSETTFVLPLPAPSPARAPSQFPAVRASPQI